MSPRDRAFAELIRVRGWLDDAALEKAIAEAAGADFPARLLATGLLTEEQVATLWEIVDCVEVSSRGRGKSRGSGGTSDATLRPPGSPSASDATLTPSASKAGASSSLSESAPSGRVERIGPYRLMRELGRGGMGVVYRARHEALGREVALKVMLSGIPEDDPDTERFRREAGLVARVGRHPNLVSVHEIGRAEDRLYFTMDYIDGRSAKQRVEDEGAFPAREAAALCADIAAALEFVHRAGVLHRDVKPHNVLIDRAGRGFLTDFGLAKGADCAEGLTVSGAALGTPAYMAPEVAARGAKQATPRSDVYSLGATLYELLAGRPPFTGLTGMDLIRAVAEADPPSPLALRPDLHPDLGVVCEKAMEKDPARRYDSAAALEADLRRFVNGEPIHARPVGKWERLRRRAKRHAGVLVASVAALAILAAAGTWSGLRWWRIEQARRAAAAAAAGKEREAAPELERGRAELALADEADAAGRDEERAAAARRAADHFARAAALLPGDAEVHFLLGRALNAAGRPLEALPELERAVDLNPKHSLAWFEHGLIAQDAWLKVRGTFGRRVSISRPNEFGFRSSSAPVFQSWISAGKGTADRPWKEMAARDFAQVVATGAAKERGLYGQAMILYLDGKFSEAIAKLDEVVKDYPRFAPALAAEAEIRDYATQSAADGVEWRRRLCEVQPANAGAAIDYATSLAAVGRRDEARDAVVKALGTCDRYLELAEGAWTLAGAGAFTEAEAAARRAVAAAATPTEKLMAFNILREALLSLRRFDDARAVLDANVALYGADAVAAQKAIDFSEEGRYADAVASFRAVPGNSPYRHWATQTEAWAEWMCGNLHRAKAAAAWGRPPGETAPANLSIVRLDLGELDAALAEFEAQLAAAPDSAIAWSNLSGAQFLHGDFRKAMDSLAEAFERSPVPDNMKEQVRKIFVNLRKRAAEAKTPAEAGKLVESIGAMLMLAASQGAPNAEGAGAARDAERAVWWALQEFYWINGLPEKSLACGAQYLRLRRHGNVLFKQARAFAALGKTDAALRTLREAMENGFDEAERLDGEKAFDAMRQLPEFAELRSRCR